jgi:hypothetical protein
MYDLDRKVEILSQLLQNRKTTKAVNLVNDPLFAQDQNVFMAVVGLLEKDLKSGLCLLAGLIRKKALTPIGSEDRYPWLAVKHHLYYLLYSQQHTNREDFSALSEKMLTLYDTYDLNVEKTYYFELLKLYFTDTLNTLKIVINPDYVATPATEKMIRSIDAEYERFRGELLARNPSVHLPKKEEELSIDETEDYIQHLLGRAIKNNLAAAVEIKKMTESILSSSLWATKPVNEGFLAVKYPVARGILLFYFDSKKNQACLFFPKEEE